uniref:MOFRL-associated domain-containing protein n=1 Tax=Arcella intermedia TaxID=1963864 RepID=A0A6B2L503_9EUKA|eukprot:TRINITY_DN8590_c0_g1_i1.p1 TRINITY_DN8590_c0_g1~~TRINITY_DN8590_c0_g1_i1.p1  ORF type:complete len:435 (-),score=120.12 TRINITY_DN8590_c0_g1_i1:34-1272(-)
MALAIYPELSKHFKGSVRGSLNIPYGQEYKSNEEFPIHFNYSAHPTPDESGMVGAKNILKIVQSTSAQSLVFVLISGGGSALLPLPAGDLTLDDLKQTNSVLLNNGLSIQQLNTIRKHTDALKGGQLARWITSTGAHCISLILSDVVGDDLQVIASGPTAPDVTTFKDVLNICESTHIWDKLPKKIVEHITNGVNNVIPDTPKPTDPFFGSQVKNFLIGSASVSAAAVSNHLKSVHGFEHVSIFTSEMEGEASEFGFKLPSLIEKLLQSANTTAKTIAFIGTGEFTVTIKGKGRGGRNQEMLLAFLIQLQKISKTKEDPLQFYDFAICSAAFDGIEGNSPAMGAIVSSETLEKLKLKLNEVDADKRSYYENLQKILDNNDSHTFFQFLGDAIITGQTGTNVNDMLLILLQKK